MLQCVLVAMYQFVQLDRHLQAIGQLGCSETLLHILMDYGPSFKAGYSPVEPHTTLNGACTHRAACRLGSRYMGRIMVHRGWIMDHSSYRLSNNALAHMRRGCIIFHICWIMIHRGWIIDHRGHIVAHIA